MLIDTKVERINSGYCRLTSHIEEDVNSFTPLLIKNQSPCGILQLDFYLAPAVFVIGFDSDINKIGVSVNSEVALNPFSLLLSEPLYLVIPFTENYTPSQIKSLKFKAEDS